MNFKALGIGVTAAFTVATGTALVSTPAQAISLTGSINLTGDPPASASIPDLTAVNQSGNATFNAPTFITGSGDFSSVNPFAISINPLPLKLEALATILGTTVKQYSSTGANPFINFGSQTIGGDTNNLSFVLNPGLFTGTFTNGGFNLTTVAGPLFGQFMFGNTTAANGTLTAFQTASNSGYTISLTATPIPTPALLPGLIALGAGVLRKRKSEAAAESVA